MISVLGVYIVLRLSSVIKNLSSSVIRKSKASVIIKSIFCLSGVYEVVGFTLGVHVVDIIGLIIYLL